VLAPPACGSCLIRRLGFPDEAPRRVPVTELCEPDSGYSVRLDVTS
jgi:hypothetical protein